MKICR